MKSLFKTVALITFFSILTRVAGFLFRIFLSRTIGAEGLGIYQSAFSVFGVLLTVVSSGLPFVISRMTASYSIQKDKSSKGKMVTSALILAIIISSLLCLVVFLFRNIFSNIFTEKRCIEILIVLLPSLIFSAIYSVFRGALWGENNYFALCISELFEQVVRIFVCVLLLGNILSVIDGAISVAWSLTIACAVSAFFVMLLYFFYGGSLGKPNKSYKKIIKQSTPITGVRIGGSLIQPLVALIIPMRLMAIGYTSSQAMALYGIAVGMTFPLLFIPGLILGSLSTALVPDISSAMQKGDSVHIEKRIKTSLNFTLLISFLFVPLFLGVGEIIGVFLYDNALSGVLLQSAAWVLVPLGLTNMSSSLLNSMGMEVKSCINYFFGAIVLFLSIWFLPIFVGINAFPIGMGLSMTVTAILNIVMIKRKTKVKVDVLKPILKLALVSLPVSAIVAFISQLLSYVLPNFFVLLISCLIGVACFVLLAIVFGMLNINYLWTITKDRLKFRKKWVKLKK